jgi:hypothetical protein
MRTIHADNVNEALHLGLLLLQNYGVKRNSRNGEVLVVDGPVCTIYEKPRQRVLMDPRRNANPFFHLFESLWMLAGRNDVAYVSQFAKAMENFSDDGIDFHGAYGYRWRKFFKHDQLPIIIERLKNNPDDRRCVLQMWDTDSDLGASVKDVPCNTHIYFSIDRAGRLDMTVCNRSNDIIWGAYGANAVHMSVLQEYMAYCVGVPMGRYYQISNNWHGYTDVIKKQKLFSITDGEFYDPYRCDHDQEWIQETSIFNEEHSEKWDSQNEMFLESGYQAMGYTDVFFKKTAIPMLQAWAEWKSDKSLLDRTSAMLKCLENMPYQSDWKRASIEWVKRKQEKL